MVQASPQVVVVWYFGGFACEDGSVWRSSVMSMVAAVRHETSEVRWESVLLLGVGVSFIWLVGLVSTFLRPSWHGVPLSFSAVVAALRALLVFYKDSSDI